MTSRKQFFYGGVNGVWYLDPATHAWTAPPKPAGDPPVGIDHCAAYDPMRDRIYDYGTRSANRPGTFLSYDVKRNAWSAASAAGPGPATSNDSIFSYDAASDRLVIIRHKTGEGHPIFKFPVCDRLTTALRREPSRAATSSRRGYTTAS